MLIGRLTLSIAAIACFTACGATAVTPETKAGSQVQTEDSAKMTDITFISIDGQPMALADYAGKAVLVVNTASKCGHTPQYRGLQELYETFEPQGLVVLGVPSGDFGSQELATEKEVKAFCELNYGVTFPLTKKYEVTGNDRHPFFAGAEAALGDVAVPKWNFHKVLVDNTGAPIKAYPSATQPADAELVADIEAALAG